MCAKSFQSILSLCDPTDCRLPGSSVHGILQARIPEWTAMPSSRGSSYLRGLTCVPYAPCIGRQILYHIILISCKYDLNIIKWTNIKFKIR